MFLSVVVSFRVARKIGAGESRNKLGDYAGGMSNFKDALMLLASPRLDRDFPGWRPLSSTALYGYCWSAEKLGEAERIVDCLSQWRPSYLEWLKSPLTPEEDEYLRWFEWVWIGC
jgi:hypothetical protein